MQAVKPAALAESLSPARARQRAAGVWLTQAERRGRSKVL